MIKIGRQDKKFPETESMLTASDRGFLRYYKRFNKRGRRKHAQYRVKPSQRISGNQFSDYPPPAYAGKSEPRSD